MNCEKNTVVRRGLASLSVLLASGGFIASSAFAQDECSTAPTLQLNTPTAFSTLTATASAGIPLDVFCPNTSLLWNAASPDVWFKWTAPSDGVATFNTCTADTSAIDSSIALYTGVCGTLVQVGCNGDMLHNQPGGCNTTDAKVANFAVTAGTTYYVRIAGIDSEFGVARGNGRVTVTHSHIAAWGDNSFNQCDVAPGIYNPIKITAGDSHALAINSDGTVRAWGSNSLGQLNVPAGLASPRDVSAGSNFSIAARADGSLVGWGSNTSGRATPPSTVLDANKVAAGVFHGLALRSNGAVVAWGAGLTNTGLSNNWGQSIIPAAAQSGIVQIAAGNVHSLALTSTGQVIAWGAGTTNTGVSPRFGQSIVPAAAQSDVEKIAAGYHHSVALKRDGSVVCWGAGSINSGNLPNYGQSIVPAGLGPVMDIAAGRYHTVALLSNGVVSAWGLGTDFQTTNPAAPGLAGSIAAGGNVTFSRYVPCVGGTPETYYRDIDGDGFGNPIATIVACTGVPTGYAANSLDCNDNYVGYADVDGDGYGAGSPLSCGGITSNSDCNDADVAINPAASEICDAGNVDENCNGVSDNDDALVLDVGRTDFFVDADNDLYTLSSTNRFCDLPALGYRAAASSLLDCNDAVAAINPGMTELCDASNVDENCNGVSDNDDAGADATTKSDFFADADNDTFTVAGASRFCDLPAGYLAAASIQIDCNDAVAAINPAATEICDASNTDENCNNLADNADPGADQATKFGFYLDADNDTYTVARVSHFCDIVAGYRPAVSAQIDCNDAVAAINPGATELCDAGNVDENCNGIADNNDAGADAASKSDFFADSDNDTFTVAAATRFCDIVAGYLASASAQVDCDDASSAVYPGAVELCATVAIDNNCDGEISDVDPNAADKVDFFRDGDLDGFSTVVTSKFCSGTTNSGWMQTSSAQPDCNDASNAVYPGAVELCATASVDNNCDTVLTDVDANAADKVDFFGDADLDGFTTSATSKFCSGTTNAGWLETPSAQPDCDDASNAVYPGAVELCATVTVDNNCDSVIDDVDVNAADKVDFFRDADLDEFTTAETAPFCPNTLQAGWLEDASNEPDCDDSSNATFPGADELCATSTIDNNCDGVTDDVDNNAADKVNFFRDSDLDGFTTTNRSRFCSGTINSGWLETPSAQPDCNDLANDVYPGAVELCATTLVDNNCDTVIADVDANAADKVDFYGDSDLDGYTTAATSKFCTGTTNSGWLETPSAQPDCDDLANDVYPGAVELCATVTVDNNCDTVVSDVDANAADKVDFYGDSDLDSYTTAATSKFCSGTTNSGWLETPSAQADCDDAVAAVNPGMSEICDSADTDENCSGAADDADAGVLDSTRSDFWADSDADTYTVAAATRFCDMPAGFLAAASTLVDCNDAVAAINPGMSEVCDAADIDENCSGAADDADAGVLDSTRSDFWADSDADTYTVAAATRFCDMPAGFLAAASTLVDCNDGDAGVNPGMSEICDSADTDENCSGAADDADAGVLDSTRSDFWADSDADTYTVAAATRFCDMPAGFLAAASTLVDCNDGDAGVNPGMTELCDAANVDENCSGAADDADAGVLDSTRSDFWADSDADTYTVAAATRFCDMPAGFLAAASNLVDCNDAVAAINPGMSEICDSANTDENCSGAADDADAGVLDSTRSDFWADSDADTYTVAAATRFCDMPAGFLAAASTLVDCNDAVAGINPGKSEICDAADIDENCSGTADDADADVLDSTRSDFWADSDADTYTVAAATRFCDMPAGFLAAASTLVDCNDGDAGVNPGMTELCDAANVDENCNNVADNDDAGAADSTKFDFFADADSDSYSVATATRFCDIVPGFVAIVSTSVDCDDSSSAVYPGAAELCATSTVDNNCDGSTNDVDATAADKVPFYRDSDLDGFTTVQASRFCPGTLNSGWLEVPSASVDCDDSSNASYPGAVELCATASVDNNCDGSATDVDANAADKVDFFRDSDLDGFSTAETAKYCPGSTQSGWLQIASTQADCNDLDGAISPAAVEICDASNIDENCNGASDDNDAGVDDATRSDFFADADADGVGSDGAVRFCDMPAGYSAVGGDTCPSDPLKQAPGTCGCGVVDADANSNGVIDCVEIGVSLQPSLTIVRPSVDFTVSVNSTTPVVPVVGLQVALTFDPTMLEVTGADPSGPFEAMLGLQINNQLGTILVGVGTLGEPVMTGGTMISVRFKVKANAPTDCDARERIAFDSSRPVTSRFSRVDGTAFLPVLEPMLAFTVDGAAPTISSVPQDSVQASADCSALVPDMIGLVVATDDCTSTAGLVVTQSPAAGSSLGLGSHPITFTVTDAAGNAAVLAGSFQVNGASLDYYDDADLDTYGSALASAQASCHPVAGKVPNNTDCDDSSAAAYPGALELCADATVDNNCDGNAIDVDANAADKVDFYRDGDGDGYTTLETARFCPSSSNAGYRPAVSASIDCNDADSSVFPGAVENCANAGIDNDCDTIAADDAEAIDSIAYMLDADQDGFGAGPALMSCSPVPGRVTNADDCDDSQVLYVDTDGDGVGAGSPAACGVPSNNDGCPSNADLTAVVTYYADVDGDGSGNPSASQQSCDSVAPVGFSTNSNDLCDGNAQLLSPRTYYTDADGDGFGDVGAASSVCEVSAPAGFSSDSSDCNDGAVLYIDSDGDGVGAGAPAACGVPSNNDGCPNNAALIAIATYYRDVDGDGAGDSTDSIQSCDSPAPAGYSATGGDTCPIDPAKTAPGACGCGVADTDTDSDGLADCVDNCPSVANADQRDCNSNGTGDACEIAAGTDQDCNANGFLDSCDLASGTSTDLDGSGAPDDCEYVVGGSGYASIQAAIDAAPNGTTIKVAPGTWAPISVSSRALVIQGIGSRDVTFIDGGSSSRAVEISGSAGSRFILRGFTIRNGRAAEGAGMLITDGGPLVENCVFTGNIATGIGGAVRAINSAADFALCSFASNSAASGGAVANSGIATSGATLNFSSCQFRSNTASTDGGAIANSGRLFLLECTVEQNIAGSLGGGVRQLETGDTTIFTSRFCMNVPDNINGAFTAVGDNILSDDCNANGLCDADEIAAGDVRDCNSNGVIDSCEITGGAADIDGDGRLDRCEILRGDLDLDGLVNGVDLALILTNWGTSGSRGDVNGDGIVDGADLTIVLGGWGVVPSF